MKSDLTETINTVKAQATQINQALHEAKQHNAQENIPSFPAFIRSAPPPQPPSPPKWLIIKDSIYNTHKLIAMYKGENNKIHLDFEGNITYTVSVKNIDELWKKLQYVFTYGVTKEENEKITDIVQKDGNGSNPAVANCCG
jgi:hypothetical protein